MPTAAEQNATQGSPAPSDSKSRDIRRAPLWQALGFRNISAVYLLVLVVIVFGIWIPDNFLKTETIAQIANESAIPCIVALALVIPLAAGVYDLSIGYTLAAVAVWVAWLLGNTSFSPAICIGLGLLMGLVVGIANGVIVVLLRVDSFIGTLASGSLLTAVALIISGNAPLTE